MQERLPFALQALVAGVRECAPRRPVVPLCNEFTASRRHERAHGDGPSGRGALGHRVAALPFTGTAFELHENDQLASEIPFLDGNAHGPCQRAPQRHARTGSSVDPRIRTRRIAPCIHVTRRCVATRQKRRAHPCEHQTTCEHRDPNRQCIEEQERKQNVPDAGGAVDARASLLTGTA